jgi:pimeloyl-ACP methyl ester carboxylesterase
VDVGIGKGLFIPMIAAMSLIGCNLQYNMLYYPSTNVPSGAELAARRIQFWPSGPDGYRGFIGTAAIPKAKGTLIVFHGNAGTAADRIDYTDALGALGYRVILAEYPKYGRREGALGEKAFVADAQATVRMAAETYGGPLFLLGESLGCAVAAGVTRDKSLRIEGILLITPWDTLAAVSKSHFPWLPVSLFLKDRYDNGENLRLFPGRIGIVAAERDTIVPSRHARALYQALPGSKKMWTITGADHNDWLDFINLSRWREWMLFIDG